MATLGFSWMDFHKLFAMVQDNLRQATTEPWMPITSVEQFCTTMVDLTSGMTFRKHEFSSRRQPDGWRTTWHVPA
jgi:hypothetical protein